MELVDVIIYIFVHRLVYIFRWLVDSKKISDLKQEIRICVENTLIHQKKYWLIDH